MTIRIGNRAIGSSEHPFVIAEMSGNHNRSLDRAMEIVDEAARAGAHALKLQTYTADTMTLDIRTTEFIIQEPTSLWNGRSLYDLYEEASTPWEWHRPLFERARELGMIPLSTPFDASAVDFLEALGSDAYKVASFEITDLALISKIGRTHKPMIISTGMATPGEISEAVDVAREAGCPDLVLLKCTSTYPASPEDSNLATIPHMREMFHCEVGVSDHTVGIGAAVCAVALGATVIEKHFTLRRADGGVDSAFSIEPGELAALVVESRRAWQAVGSVSYGTIAAEVASLQFRRSIYFVKDIGKGERITPDAVRVIRPGHGLAARFLQTIIGMTVSRDVKRGSPVSWDVVK